MRKLHSTVMAAALALVAATPAVASVITWQSRAGSGGNYGNAAGYKAAAEAYMLAPATAGYGDAEIAYFDGISNGALFGANGNIVHKVSVDFTVAAASVWDFRFGLDLGSGGAIFVDDAASSFMDGDNWAGGTYDSPQAFTSFGSNLGIGVHSVIIYGFEGCCGGPAFGQYRVNGGTWQTFAANDGMSPPEEVDVPEPTTLGLMGLGLLGLAIRRRSRRA